jgi:AcrR family transcriptional regulator
MVRSVPEGIREAKKRETRRALSTAALRLATERGLHGFTLEEVARDAGVSPRTFFNYFASKEAAIVGLDDDELSVICEALEARPAAETPVQALVAVMIPEGEALAEEAHAFALRRGLVEQHPELLPHHLAIQHQLEAALTAALARRLGSSLLDPYPSVVVAAVYGALRATTEWHQRVGASTPLRDALDDAAAMIASGLQVRP